ncbi:MAG: hypothetical protein QW412_01425 [Candidatus Aenigmatarchaeota archaeon]
MNFSLELLKLLLKYGISKYNCEKRSKEQIKELYLKNYPDKKEEMEWMIKHKSRTADSIAFSSLTICAANKGREKKDSQETREIVGWQINIAKVASAMDDLHDEFLVPYLVEKYERGINKEVYTSNIIELIENYERMYDFALKQKPKYLKNKQVIPSVIAGSCLRVEKAYRASLEASNPDTLKVYIEGKEGVQRFQAKDIAISVALKKNDLEGVLEIIGNGEYIKKLSELHDKLGIIGGKDCVIVNQLSWEKRNIEMEEVNQALQEFFTPLTKLNQAVLEDDTFSS